MKQPLSVTHPELAEQAVDWDPSKYFAGGRDKLKWRCDKGHVYETLIWYRTGRDKTGCPICANRVVLKGFNDLATIYPELAHQLQEADASEVLAFSNKRLKWKCERGHVWEAVLNSRKAGTGCPYCSNNRILPGYNDLATTHPEVAAEAHGWDPTTISFGSDKVQEWKCENNHIWKSAIKSRTIKKSKCLICGNRELSKGINDVATKFPELAKQANGWDPSKVLAGAHDQLSWKCDLGHEWIASLLNRTRRNDGCPYCAGKKALKGFNDLKSQRPDIAAQANGWNTEEVTVGSGKKFSWICEHKHTWTASVYARTTKETGCPYCQNREVLKGFNDLATSFPDIAVQADGWDPSTVVAGSNSFQNWICGKGHKWRTQVTVRTYGGSGCPVCSGLVTVPGLNDLATTHPELALEADGWDPTQARSGSEKKLKWKCKLGHSWTISPNSRTSNNSGCPICGNQQLLVGFNDLATTHPEIAAQAVGWNPSRHIAGHEPKMWKCEKGHKWKTSITIRKRGSNCPTCSPTGFDPNLDAWLYFLEDEERGFLQIGITNYPENRLATHYSNGWSLIELRGPMEGYLARAWETSMLRLLAKRDLRISKSTDIPKFDGFSESWIRSSFPISSLKELMNLVEEEESAIGPSED